MKSLDIYTSIHLCLKNFKKKSFEKYRILKLKTMRIFTLYFIRLIWTFLTFYA